MECYRFNCNESCDNFKKLYCLRRITKEQNSLISEIRGKSRGYCKVCGKETIKAKHYIAKKQYIPIDLCTNCSIRSMTKCRAV